ncbi:hypothetical protein B0H10DRAFT_1958040 [Mycena sp. CBHHK59/15]|nr:hypothetical protein B0H10DRAFT_1958040 [Mycena sp. CBHHK59/15]
MLERSGHLSCLLCAFLLFMFRCSTVINGNLARFEGKISMPRIGDVRLGKAILAEECSFGLHRTVLLAPMHNQPHIHERTAYQLPPPMCQAESGYIKGCQEHIGVYGIYEEMCCNLATSRLVQYSGYYLLEFRKMKRRKMTKFFDLDLAWTPESAYILKPITEFEAGRQNMGRKSGIWGVRVKQKMGFTGDVASVGCSGHWSRRWWFGCEKVN